MAKRVGDRVGAILGGNNTTVRFFGYGVRVEDEIPAAAAGWMAEALREEGITNPCILLDSGERVYGCECWWGSEATIRAKVQAWEEAGVKIVMVTVKEARGG